MKKIYLCVTKDKYELPVAVADSPKELARLCGVSESAVSSGISHERYGNYNSRYKRVIIEDDE